MVEQVLSNNDLKIKIANHWDKNVCDLNRAESFEALDKMRPQQYPYVKKELRLTNLDGKKIIEIGVGCALEACTILTNTRPSLYVLYDISPVTLKTATGHIKKHHPDVNLQSVNGDMENIKDFTDNFFDRVHAFGSIHHTPNPQQAIKEISRILKPDGEFIFMMYCKDSIRYRFIFPLTMKMKLKKVHSADEWVRVLDGWDNPLGKAYSKKEIKNFCKDAKLKVKRMKGYEYGFALYIYGIKN